MGLVWSVSMRVVRLRSENIPDVFQVSDPLESLEQIDRCCYFRSCNQGMRRMRLRRERFPYEE